MQESDKSKGNLIVGHVSFDMIEEGRNKKNKIKARK